MPAPRTRAVDELWGSRGGEFPTEPKDHGAEIRRYLRDPDGYLIELGQGAGILAEMGRPATR
ncbi:hypothetical protein Q3W71_13945 [Micromonospora sp. C28SCA-DRY-2]|uniref:VOC family protein n=1 Tax=Micromonospora sp. C28SCA-DRY-2 TaxID=3059522 RepID=UPI002677546B|nr:hypothetical protein [Micromonospora sp. C28SCA-DRY-2]MDO3702771.1 hypothetical protein [Micromonospora sp. C28SCA-DRY-2]